MKITKSQLIQIIKEEIKNFLKEKEEIKTEGSGPGGWGPDDAKKPGESLSDIATGCPDHRPDAGRRGPAATG